MRPLAAGDSPKQPACCGESVGKAGRWTAALILACGQFLRATVPRW